MGDDEKQRGTCEGCGLGRRVLTRIESGQWLCRRCRAELRRLVREQYTKPSIVERLRASGFSVDDNLSKEEGERLLALDALRNEGGNAAFNTPRIEIERLLRIRVARRRGLNVPDSVSHAEITRLTVVRPVRHYHANVVGVTYRNPDGSKRQDIISECEVFEHVLLEHDEGNRHHDNAVKVITKSGEQIGFLGRELADEVMIKSREGYAFSAFIKRLGGDPDADQPFWAQLLIIEGKPGSTVSEVEEYAKLVNLSDAGWVH